MDNGKKYVLYCRERKMKAMWLQMLQSVIQKLSRGSSLFLLPSPPFLWAKHHSTPPRESESEREARD